MEERIFTLQEAAEFFGVTPRTIQNWIANKELGCYRMGEDGRIVRVGTDHIEQYMANHEVKHEYERAEAEA